MTAHDEISRRTLLRLAGAAGVGTAAASTGVLSGWWEAAEAKTDALRVGVIAPFSGINSYIGAVVNNALTASVKQINATKGVKGRKVSLLVRDSNSDAGAAAQAYTELAGRRDLLGLLWCEPKGFDRVLPQIRAKGTPVVAVFEDPFSAGLLYPEGEATGRSVFQMTVPDRYAKEVLADYAKNDRGYTSAAIVYDRQLDPEGATRRYFEDAFGAAGLTLAGAETVATADTDFGAQLGRLKAAAPQVLYLDGLADTTAAIATALSEMGADYVDTPTAKGPAWHPHVFGSYKGINQFYADLGEEAAKVGSVTAWHLGGLSMLPSFPIADWMKKYAGKEPTTLARELGVAVTPAGGEEFPANALWALLSGLKKAGSTDRTKLVRGMETMGAVTFASLPFGYDDRRHHAVVKDDVAVFTLERLRGPAPTDPSYELGAEWQEGGAYANRAAAATLLVRPTLEANRRSRPGVVDQVLRGGFGTQCTKHGEGTLGKECKIH